MQRPAQVLQVGRKSVQQSLYVRQEGLHWHGLVGSVPDMPHRPTQESTALIFKAIVKNVSYSGFDNKLGKRISLILIWFLKMLPSMKLLALASTITAALVLIRNKTKANADFMLNYLE